MFEHAGQPYEVRRTIRGKGHTPEAELFGGGMPLASGTTEVDAEIRRLLHMDLHVFRASVYAEQKQLDAFSDVTPGKRKEMALRLLGIRPVEDARNASRREARATKESAVQLAGAVADLAALEAELKDAKEAVAEAKRIAKAAAAELKEAIAVEKAAKRAFAESDAVRQRVETLTVELRAQDRAAWPRVRAARRARRARGADDRRPGRAPRDRRGARGARRHRGTAAARRRPGRSARPTWRRPVRSSRPCRRSTRRPRLGGARGDRDRARTRTGGDRRGAEAERAHRAALLEQARRAAGPRGGGRPVAAVPDLRAGRSATTSPRT